MLQTASKQPQCVCIANVQDAPRTRDDPSTLHPRLFLPIPFLSNPIQSNPIQSNLISPVLPSPSLPKKRNMARYTPPSPATTSRSAYTSAITASTPPPDADTTYTHLFRTRQQLCQLLLDHPAMAPNRAQMFDTPAADSNTIYLSCV
jgi:hypothetical protein